MTWTPDLFLYRKVFDEALDIILVADAVSGIILDCNQAAIQALGWSREELVGRHQRTLHPAEERSDGFSRTFREHLGERSGDVLQSRVLTKDGRVLDVTIKASLFEHQGRRLVLGVFHDVTERLGYEKRIWELSRFPEENPNPVLRATAEGRILYANAAACAVFHEGGCALEDLLPPLFRQAIALALAQDAIQIIETTHGARGYRYAISPMQAVGYVNLYGMDITERMEIEKALARSEERFRLALKAANFGSWDWDLASGQVSWSETVAPLFGLAPGAFGGDYPSFLALAHPGDRRMLEEAVRAALEDKKEYNLEHRIVQPGGRVR